jgi:cysteine-rich repeat protein
MRRLVSTLILVLAGCGSSGPGVVDGPKGQDHSIIDGQPPGDQAIVDGKRAVDGKLGDKAKTDAKLAVEGIVVTDKAVASDTKYLGDVTPPGCGDGTRSGTEECDDGNLINLDGCDASCHFEQNLRVNKLIWQKGTDTVCTKNAVGGAVTDLALAFIQPQLDGAIADGSISLLLNLLELDDLTGTSDPGLWAGFLGGTAAAGFNNASELDWWFTVDPTMIDGKRHPLKQLPASISGSVLTIGPGTIAFPINLGAAADISLTDVLWKLDVGPTSTPTASTGGSPGHLASEHLSPTLKSFATTTATTHGQVCGNVTAASLDAVPIPSQLSTYVKCSEGYTSTNTLLDLFVGGCSIVPVILVALNATQPDASDPTAPVAGAGAPYKLSVDSTTKRVNGCKDKNGATVTLSTCLASAAFSAFFKVTTDRVIIK